MTKEFTLSLIHIAPAIVLFGLALGPNALAQPIYSSIALPLPANVASEGPEAYGFKELGDGLVFASGTGRQLTTVKVIMSDWACASGHWNNPLGGANPNGDPKNAPCVTPPEATFRQAITLNIYSSGTTPVLLATKTQTFNVPFRPSSDPKHCSIGSPAGGDGTNWYNATDNTCYHGIAFPVSFDFSSEHLTLPASAIVTVAFNSSDYGPTPLRPQACNAGGPFHDDDNCPYDSLNISTDGGPFVGSVIDPNGIFVRYAIPNGSCTGSAPTGVLTDDTSAGCWVGYHPQIEVDATPGRVPVSGGACNGTYNGAFKGNITVTREQNCNFTGGSIDGNISLKGGTLTLNHAAVDGNVHLDGGGTFQIGPGVTIDGDVQVEDTPTTPGAMDTLCGAAIKGDVQFHNSSVPAIIGGAPGSVCAGNQIGGNLEVMNDNAPVQVLGNVVKGNLQCQGNTAISGSGNTARQKKDQCSAF